MRSSLFSLGPDESCCLTTPEYDRKNLVSVEYVLDSTHNMERPKYDNFSFVLFLSLVNGRTPLSHSLKCVIRLKEIRELYSQRQW